MCQKLLQPFKRHLIDMEFAWHMMGNFTNLPVLLFQGQFDRLVKVQQSYRSEKKLRELGFDVQFVEIPGEDHWIASTVFSQTLPFDWMDKRSREGVPKDIDYTTWSPRYGGAYWVRIDEFEQAGKPARVRAKLEGEAPIVIETENVARISCQTVVHMREFDVLINGEKMDFDKTERGADGYVSYRVGPEPAPDARMFKTARQPGPIKEVFNSRFMLVYGAAPEDRRNAESMARDWEAFAKGRAIMYSQDEITDADIERSNLVLFGTPKSNKLLARIADRMPVKITDDEYIVGAHRYAQDGLGMMWIYPNPLNPERYVVVCHGVHYGRHLPVNHKYDLLPDFIIYNDNRDWDATNEFLCAGFFDKHWQLSEDLTWTIGPGDVRPDARVARPVRGFPQ